jgi:ADP-ribose pyrophosphatase YjhB (NUDIX family)
MRFAPDLHVFPGGSVESGETPGEAAVRETREETGIEIHPGDLVSIGRWVTPAGQSARFDARFFAAVVTPETDVVAGSAEVVSSVWLTPRAALDRFAAGDLVLWPPTIGTLQRLEGIRDDAQLRSAYAPLTRQEPEAVALERVDADRTRLLGTWAGGVEGRAWVGWILGRERWVVINPGDPTGAATDAVMAAAHDAGASLDGVVLTSLEPEHHAGVALFAVGLGVPLGTPPGVPRIGRDRHIELLDGAPLPFGDVRARVSVLAPDAADSAARNETRWADGFSRLRLVGEGWELP